MDRPTYFRCPCNSTASFSGCQYYLLDASGGIRLSLQPTAATREWNKFTILLHLKPDHSPEQGMLFESIPRGTIAATLTAADMLSRLEACPNKTPELRHAVAVVSRRMLDPHRYIERDELERCSSLVAWLYLE